VAGSEWAATSTAVARKDSRYSKAQYSRAGRLNSLGPILHRAIISNGRMQNDEQKKTEQYCSVLSISMQYWQAPFQQTGRACVLSPV
jgi:hypothetical protein